MTEFNIKFKDENQFISFDDDTEYIAGCETCDYGSEYINTFSFYTTNYTVNVEFNQMYSYSVSVGDILKILVVELCKFTEEEFIEYIKNSIENLGEEKATQHYRNENPLKKLEVTKGE